MTPIVASCSVTDCYTATPTGTRCAKHQQQRHRAARRARQAPTPDPAPTLPARPGTWALAAACKPGFTEKRVDEQVLICATCPVIAECRAYGLADPAVRLSGAYRPWIVYGGRTIAELAEIVETRTCQR